MEGKSTSAAYVEEVSAKKKPGFGTRVKQHYKKWWWLHLLFFIASTLIIVLCVYVFFLGLFGVLNALMLSVSMLASHALPRTESMIQPSRSKT